MTGQVPVGYSPHTDKVVEQAPGLRNHNNKPRRPRFRYCTGGPGHAMPFYQVSEPGKRLIEKQPVSFKEQGWLERGHLQPLIRDHPQVLDSELIIISEEFEGWDEGVRRMIDLLGLDRQGNLVVIELKRVEGGAHMELQALRYAAMVSAMDFEGVVRTYEEYLSGRRKDSDGARGRLEGFLEQSETPVISRTPRVVLVAPSFSREITTTVLWLNEQGLDIRCVEANLYNLEGKDYLDIEQVIPLPSASDYMVKLREKQKAERKTLTESQRLHLEFWTQFHRHLKEKGSPTRLGKPPKAAISSVLLGPSPFRLLPWNVIGKESGLWIRFVQPEAETRYGKVHDRYRRQVEEALSRFGSLDWAREDRRISLSRPSELNRRETWPELNDWPELNEWMAAALETACGLLTDIVARLDAEEESAAQPPSEREAQTRHEGQEIVEER